MHTFMGLVWEGTSQTFFQVKGWLLVSRGVYAYIAHENKRSFGIQKIMRRQRDKYIASSGRITFRATFHFVVVRDK